MSEKLMCQTKLVIMDEPIAGIAPDLSHDILKKLRELSISGVSFLIVEHRLEIILEYVDQVYVMSGGRIIAEGRDKEILENPEVVEGIMALRVENLSAGYKELHISLT